MKRKKLFSWYCSKCLGIKGIITICDSAHNLNYFSLYPNHLMWKICYCCFKLNVELSYEFWSTESLEFSSKVNKILTVMKYFMGVLKDDESGNVEIMSNSHPPCTLFSYWGFLPSLPFSKSILGEQQMPGIVRKGGEWGGKKNKSRNRPGTI